MSGKNRGQILSRTDQRNEVNKEFIMWLFVPSFIAFNELFSSGVNSLGLLACIYRLLRVFFLINSPSFLLKIVKKNLSHFFCNFSNQLGNFPSKSSLAVRKPTARLSSQSACVILCTNRIMSSTI